MSEASEAIHRIVDAQISRKIKRLKELGITTMAELSSRIQEPEVKALYEELKWLRAEQSGVCIGWDPDGG